MRRRFCINNLLSKTKYLVWKRRYQPVCGWFWVIRMLCQRKITSKPLHMTLKLLTCQKHTICVKWSFNFSNKICFVRKCIPIDSNISENNQQIQALSHPHRPVTGAFLLAEGIRVEDLSMLVVFVLINAATLVGKHTLISTHKVTLITDTSLHAWSSTVWQRCVCGTRSEAAAGTELILAVWWTLGI